MVLRDQTIFSGQAAISFVFLVGSIIVLVGVTLGFLSTSFTTSSLGFGASQRVLAIASAGAKDGFLRLVRNKDFSSSGYSVPLGSDSATVTVTQDSPAAGLATINSTVTVTFRKRTVRVVASVDSSTGEVRLVSWQEVQ